jgi:hypothetical protein
MAPDCLDAAVEKGDEEVVVELDRDVERGAATPRTAGRAATSGGTVRGLRGCRRRDRDAVRRLRLTADMVLWLLLGVN